MPTQPPSGRGPQVPGEAGHPDTPEDERKHREAALDHTIEDSFPASDPPSTDPNPDDHDSGERDEPAGSHE